MTMAAANLEIREALAAHGVRCGQSQTGREAVLWELESRLEELRLKGYERVPSTFPLAAFMARAHLTEVERQRMRHTKIRTLIAVILDELLSQPAEGGEDLTPDRRRGAWIGGEWHGRDRLRETILVGFHHHSLTGMLCDVRHSPEPSEPLTPTEAAILDALVDAAGRVVARAVLRERIGWDPGTGEATSEELLNVHVCRLRAKIGAKRVLLVKGVGYRLAA